MLTIVKPGPQTTLQDDGRWGYQRFGIGVAGVLDDVAPQAANVLVGNTRDEVVIEFVGQGPTLHTEVPLCIAVTGGDFELRVEDTYLPTWRRIYLAPGATLSIGRAACGYRGYLAVSGGFDSPVILESRSTLLIAQIGGHQGRALRAGDRLRTRGTKNREHMRELAPSASTAWSGWSINPASLGYSLDPSTAVRVLEGRHFARFSHSAREAFLAREFRIGAQANRMGYRLEGTHIEAPQGFEAISEPVTHGTIQVPPNGEPIVLLADRPTVGGYPYLATVAAVDLPRLAQLPPGSKLRFTTVSVYEAQARYLARERALTMLEMAIAEKHLAAAETSLSARKEPNALALN